MQCGTERAADAELLFAYSVYCFFDALVAVAVVTCQQTPYNYTLR